MESAKKRVVGRPFEKGVDPRRNLGGRPKNYISHAYRSVLTEEDARQLGEILKKLAFAGDLRAIEILMDRIEGKAIARHEEGQPGEFGQMDALQDMSPDELRALIKVASEKKTA
jgi:hypothetical protein